MAETILLGWQRLLLPLPGALWRKQVRASAAGIPAHLAHFSPDHLRVRAFAVSELPRAGAPLSPERIAAGLDLPLERVTAVLDDLEKHLTFVYRGAGGAVEWAYPLTAASTPHRLTFDSGEQLYAA
jgi:hypothetical protein